MKSRDWRNPEAKIWLCNVSKIFELFLEHAALNPISSALKWEENVGEGTHSFSVFIISFFSYKNANFQLNTPSPSWKILFTKSLFMGLSKKMEETEMHLHI